VARLTISIDNQFVRLEKDDELVFVLHIDALRSHTELYEAVRDALKEYFDEVFKDLQALIRLQGGEAEELEVKQHGKGA